MYRILLLSACLVSAHRGRRVSSKPLEESTVGPRLQSLAHLKQSQNPLKELARLVLALDPAAAFSPPSPRVSSPSGNPGVKGGQDVTLARRARADYGSKVSQTAKFDLSKVQVPDLKRQVVATLSAVAVSVALPFASALAADPLMATEPPALVQSAGAKRQKTSFVTEAVNQVGPSVVRINTERNAQGPMVEGFYIGDGRTPRPIEGQGTGVILNKEGVIMTNAHVVSNVDKVTVTLNDGRTVKGSVKGFDDYMDLAAIKIDPPAGETLGTAPLGKSEDLEVGDYVIAIGNAVGLDNTVTLGIVSSLARTPSDIGLPSKKVNFIQTDAAINPGNSGGPLLNEFGEVVGINTAIRANANGIGFAIPIDTAEPALRELSKGKSIPHPYIGVSMASLTKETAKANNDDPNADLQLPELDGALVLNVAPGTSAAKAGMRKFDLITELGGKPVKTSADVQAIVDKSKVGQQLSAKVIRQQSPMNVLVTTGDLSQLAKEKSTPPAK
mmetsp:Transcript_113125/g.205735  ORF Transcript_113125/g.205735 Transcript_113125/m.205735 type:complete len:500 (-) Transcript_113125:31-1530(-)